MSDQILLAREGVVATITLNRPEKRNALTFEMYQKIAEHFTALPRDGAVKAIVITGAEGKAFGAGTDIGLFRDFKGAADGLEYEAQLSTILGQIEACPIPTIAAIAGACTGGAAAIAACCDIRIGTRGMTFGFPIARTLGNCISAASLSKLVALIGHGRVIELILAARLMEGDEALTVGLVTELHATHEEALARAQEIGRETAGLAPLTLRATKEALRRLSASQVDDRDLIALVYGSQDFREGLDAFLAKRAPNWQGR
jgi:enoyl-CoA hydratase/carnithine racemase